MDFFTASKKPLRISCVLIRKKPKISAHEEVLWLFYDNFHFSSKEREGFGVSFLGEGGGGLIEDPQWVRILHSMHSNGFDSGNGRQGYFVERQMATVRLWSLLIRVRKMSELGSIRAVYDICRLQNADCRPQTAWGSKTVNWMKPKIS